MTPQQRQAAVDELRVRQLRRRILIRAAINGFGQAAVGVAGAAAAAVTAAVTGDGAPCGKPECAEASLSLGGGVQVSTGGLG